LLFVCVFMSFSPFIVLYLYSKQLKLLNQLATSIVCLRFPRTSLCGFRNR
jgi:hypothetical protein